MSILSDRRDALHAALVDTFVAPVGGFAFSGRVDRTPPARVSAPRVFIGDTSGARVRGNAGSTYVAEFPVWIVYDGAPSAQVDGVDEIVSRIVDAAVGAGFDVTGHTPATLPAGINAPDTSRTTVVTVETSARGLTLCTPTPP